MVLHSCDNPACINPEHLFLGTPADNMNDMKAKARGRRGAHLTPERVREIKRRGVYSKDEAKRVGINHRSMYAIKRGESWAGVNP